jgi:hypothetical protein
MLEPKIAALDDGAIVTSVSLNDHDIARARKPAVRCRGGTEHPNDLLNCVTVRLEMDAGPGWCRSDCRSSALTLAKCIAMLKAAGDWLVYVVRRSLSAMPGAPVCCSTVGDGMPVERRQRTA